MTGVAVHQSRILFQANHFQAVKDTCIFIDLDSKFLIFKRGAVPDIGDTVIQVVLVFNGNGVYACFRT